MDLRVAAEQARVALASICAPIGSQEASRVACALLALEAALQAQPFPVEAQAVPDQPVAVIVLFGDIKEVSWRKGKMPEVGAKLFTRPTTAAAAGVPTGWKLVPIEPTEMMLNEGGCAHALPGPHYIGAQAAKRSWNLMLAASPVAVPGKKDNEA